MKLNPNDIHPRYRDQLSTQDYASKPAIDGVRLFERRRHVDDGGAFLELARLTASGHLEGLEDFAIRQINYSTLGPDTIKAFHLHMQQTEVWFVPPESRMLVGLLDVRESSSTCGRSMRLTLGDATSRCVFIPAGVAHGVRNLAGRPGALLYLTDTHFCATPEETDEHRLPWDTLGSDFWQISKE